jgi:predicted nucleic acid-binding protein
MSDRQIVYLDTNIVLSLITEDGLSPSAIDWFNAQIDSLAISEWVRAEFNGVTGLRRRKGELTANVANIAIMALQERTMKHFLMLNIGNEAISLAADWLRNIDCTLQTGDALHLAIAHLGGATTLATFDERFAKAAQKLKLRNLAIELIPAKPSRPVPTRRVEQERATYQGKAKKNVGKN